MVNKNFLTAKPVDYVDGNLKELKIHEIDIYLLKSYSASRRNQRFNNGSSMYKKGRPKRMLVESSC